jgi:S1-C subfamily serine protease
MKKKHKIAIGCFTTIIIIFMIIISAILNGIITSQTIENRQLKDKINKIEKETNEKINELAITIINNKQSSDKNISTFSNTLTQVSKDINTLKATNLEDFSSIIEESIKSTTAIRTLSTQGAGIIIDENGYIITTLHTLLKKNEISKIIQVLTSDGTIHEAKLIGYIQETDLALLKINQTYKPLKLEKNENIQIGDKVIAIGNPEGLKFSVTDGIISAKNRVGPNDLKAYIQTNAELNQGNSGGPLINKNGKIVGMNNFKIKDTEGIGFALDSKTLKEEINKITKNKLNQTLIT